jgi:hypothetical protein
MCTVFWDFNFLTRGETVNDERYCETLQKLRWAIGCHTVVPIPGGRLYDTGIQKLVLRYDKCLNSGGEYVEK